MTQLTESQVKEMLYENDQTYRELKDQHATYDNELQLLMRKGKLTAEDELQIATIKKQKLMLKDQMYAMIGERINGLEA